MEHPWPEHGVRHGSTGFETDWRRKERRTYIVSIQHIQQLARVAVAVCISAQFFHSEMDCQQSILYLST